MLRIGANDAFERVYMQKFREFAGRYGEFVSYERDRAARDLGIHLTRKLRTGEERVSTALYWFQLKGIQGTVLSKADFDQTPRIRIQMKVRHLQYWYLQPTSTYLGLYIEGADIFLVLNLQKYVDDLRARRGQSGPGRDRRRNPADKHSGR